MSSTVQRKPPHRDPLLEERYVATKAALRSTTRALRQALVLLDACDGAGMDGTQLAAHAETCKLFVQKTSKLLKQWELELER